MTDSLLLSYTCPIQALLCPSYGCVVWLSARILALAALQAQS